MPDYLKNSDDNALWDGVLAGSETAFELLYHRYFNDLFAYGLSLLAEEESVNDAIQDLFLEIWRRRQVLSPARSVKFYLLGSLRRRIHRIQKPFRLNSHELQSVPESHLSNHESPELLFSEKEEGILQTQKLNRWLSQLPPRQLEALELHYYHDLPYAQVADLLGIKEQSARNLVQKALVILRKISIILVISTLF